MASNIITLATIIFIILLIFFFPLILKLGVILYYWLFPKVSARSSDKKTASFKLSDLKETKSEKIK